MLRYKKRKHGLVGIEIDKKIIENVTAIVSSSLLDDAIPSN